MTSIRKPWAGTVAFGIAVMIAAATAAACVPKAAAAGLTDRRLPDIVAGLLPSVVNVTTTRYRHIELPSGQSVMAQVAHPDQGLWFGSGFIVTSNGYVVTNKHVVHNGVSFKVTLGDGQQFPATLAAESICCDIAVLKIDADQPFSPVKLGDSDTLRQGDFVIAIGNPLGFNSTVTTGIVSALNRDEHFTPFDDYIQTDAAINQGNSGGPLFNAEGEVIGVNAAIFTTGSDTGNIGIGLAIPINDAKFLVTHLQAALSGEFKPAWLGAEVQSLTPDLAAAYGIAGPWGSIVQRVIDGSPAAQVGLRPGDIITAFGRAFVGDSRALMRAIVATPAGTTVALSVLRDGTARTVPVNLAALPAGESYGTFLGEPGVPKPQLPPEATTNFGLRMAAITPELRDQYKLGARQQGVVITGVAIGSAAANKNINAGAVIVRVRDTAVASPDDVVKAVDDERQRKQPFVPVLIAEPSGLRWVSLQLG